MVRHHMSHTHSDKQEDSNDNCEMIQYERGQVWEWGKSGRGRKRKSEHPDLSRLVVTVASTKDLWSDFTLYYLKLRGIQNIPDRYLRSAVWVQAEGQRTKGGFMHAQHFLGHREVNNSTQLSLTLTTSAGLKSTGI